MTPFRAADAHVSSKVLRRAARERVIRELVHGVYLNSETWPTDPQQQRLVMALAHQVRRPELVASHSCAATAWSTPTIGTHASLEFSVQKGTGQRSGREPRVRARDLPPGHVRTLTEGPAAGLNLTSPMRTAIDLAATGRLAAGLAALDFALRSELLVETSGRDARRLSHAQCAAFTEDQLTLAAEVRWTRREARQLELALALCSPLRESPGESASYAAIALSDLPLPDCQMPIVIRNRTVYPDFLWEAERVVGECDGLVKYRNADPNALVLEKLRQEALELAGWRVVRWTASEAFYQPAKVVARIGRALRRD